MTTKPLTAMGNTTRTRTLPGYWTSRSGGCAISWPRVAPCHSVSSRQDAEVMALGGGAGVDGAVLDDRCQRRLRSRAVWPAGPPSPESEAHLMAERLGSIS